VNFKNEKYSTAEKLTVDGTHYPFERAVQTTRCGPFERVVCTGLK